MKFPLTRSFTTLTLAAMATVLAPAAAFPRQASAVPTPIAPEMRPFYDTIARVSRKAGMPLMVAQTAHTFLGRPYLASTLDSADVPETDGKEPLTSRLDAFDCVTLVENSVAIARAVAIAEPGKAPTWDAYRAELEHLRYRDGQRGSYTSRLHYFSEWIADNERRGLIKDLTPSLGGEADTRPITFMSTHREAYAKLGDDRLFKEIQDVEANLNRTRRYVLPNDKVAAILPLLQPGDIVAFATDIDGLDVVHTGLIDRLPNGEVHLLHAPEPGQPVVIGKKPLIEYLTLFPHHVGLMIARPLPPDPAKTASQ
jgi:hypothetical protein